ncbi:hypothetical protein KC19_6G154900 [Ceratodon purpureus]|uniref:Uncharacterized protein n=1 Tax=Ceratodon purpureus TaxID=3225 RepID=A0A8T0HHM3_CERPU|nr:hypothetical protein KC19_6G154900 [Ceratodon purpureus]
MYNAKASCSSHHALLGPAPVAELLSSRAGEIKGTCTVLPDPQVGDRASASPGDQALAVHLNNREFYLWFIN